MGEGLTGDGWRLPGLEPGDRVHRAVGRGSRVSSEDSQHVPTCCPPSLPRHPSPSAVGGLQDLPSLVLGRCLVFPLVPVLTLCLPPSPIPSGLSRLGHSPLLPMVAPFSMAVTPWPPPSSPHPSPALYPCWVTRRGLGSTLPYAAHRAGIPGQGAADAVQKEVQEVLGRAEVAEGVQELLHVALQEGVAAQRGLSDRAGPPHTSPVLQASRMPRFHHSLC